MLFLDRVMIPPPSVWGLLVGLASGWDGGTEHGGDGGEVGGDSECPGEGWTRGGELVKDEEEGAAETSSGGFRVVLFMGWFIGWSMES